MVQAAGAPERLLPLRVSENQKVAAQGDRTVFHTLARAKRVALTEAEMLETSDHHFWCQKVAAAEIVTAPSLARQA